MKSEQGMRRRRSRRNRSMRHGTSLVEVLVSVTAVSIALSLVAGVTYRVLQLDRSSRLQAELDQATREFARQLRTDVHGAREAEAVEANRLRLVRLDDHHVEYHWDGAAVERVERRGDTVVRRERFRRSPALQLQCVVERDERGATWVVITGDDATAAGQTARRWRVETALAADRRDRTAPRRRRVSVRRRARGGFLLAAALACLLVLTLVGAAVAQRLLVMKRQVRLDHQRAQAALVAEAGCRRVVSQLKQKPEYTGETWEIPAGILGATSQRLDAAVVELRVEAIENEPRRRAVVVVARYPADPVLGVVERRQFEIAP